MAAKSNNEEKQILKDSGFVIYDEDVNEYFCGLNMWDKQLRKAKIYHSKNYAQQAIDIAKEKNPDTRDNLKIYTVNMEISNSFSIKEFDYHDYI